MSDRRVYSGAASEADVESFVARSNARAVAESAAAERDFPAFLEAPEPAEAEALDYGRCQTDAAYAMAHWSEYEQESIRRKHAKRFRAEPTGETV